MRPVTALIIMDGFGLRERREGNAIAQQGTPNLDLLTARFPHTSIGASGMDVGLPDGQMGNSEVGHTNIGAGRVVYQELTRITKSIQDGDFYQNPALLSAVHSAKKSGKKLHLIGLLSDGGVHSHNTHLYALLRLAQQNGLGRVFVHALLDGRDTPPDSGLGYVAELQAKIREIGCGAIATLSGRYYGMDREKRFERVEKAYAAMVCGEGPRADDPEEAMRASYAAGVTDEFVLPTALRPDGCIESGDSVVFFNFRPDRAREITRAFVDPDFAGFERKSPPENLLYVCMTQYDATMPNVLIAYHPQSLDRVFGQIVSEAGLTQLRIAEYTKYAHVTFFLNGGAETVYPGEDRCLIDSPDVPTYDLKPEMSAYLVTDEVLGRIASGKYDVLVLNFANCDMVGHTGVMKAAMAAVKTVDECVGKVVEAVLQTGGRAVVTADHGNADCMLDEKTGEPFTAHTTNPVPFLVCDPRFAGLPLRSGGRLADICPTLLKLMDIRQPPEMTGTSLL